MDNITIFRRKKVTIEIGDSIITRWNDTPQEVVDIVEKYGWAHVVVNRPPGYSYGGPTREIYPQDIRKVFRQARKELLQ